MKIDEDFIADINHILFQHGEKVEQAFAEKNKEVISSDEDDIKIPLDLSLSESICHELKRFNKKIISEEDYDFENLQSDFCFVLDPLDGSYNFYRGFPVFCISLGIFQNGFPSYGFIYDILQGTIIHGSKSLGSYMIQKKYFYEPSPVWPEDQRNAISVSETESAEKATFATGFPSKFGREIVEDQKFIGNLKSFKKIRMIGSAATSISNVATGIFDVYYEKGIYVWDVAAGIPIVLGAGGFANYRFINNEGRMTVFTSNKKLSHIYINL